MSRLDQVDYEYNKETYGFTEELTEDKFLCSSRSRI